MYWMTPISRMFVVLHLHLAASGTLSSQRNIRAAIQGEYRMKLVPLLVLVLVLRCVMCSSIDVG